MPTIRIEQLESLKELAAARRQTINSYQSARKFVLTLKQEGIATCSDALLAFWFRDTHPMADRAPFAML